LQTPFSDLEGRPRVLQYKTFETKQYDHHVMSRTMSSR